MKIDGSFHINQLDPNFFHEISFQQLIMLMYETKNKAAF